ncbi:hypothetical protein EDD15DRAFT_2196872 [Pisolithus albus]|nr:hypothetical protein EDD15DRAFT_2200374 [Pisolithus albus]KAI5992662.1 hypothetical protein EDD15DRAFT_2196872 [Pisolithus albus]
MSEQLALYTGGLYPLQGTSLLLDCFNVLVQWLKQLSQCLWLGRWDLSQTVLQQSLLGMIVKVKINLLFTVFFTNMPLPDMIHTSGKIATGSFSITLKELLAMVERTASRII